MKKSLLIPLFCLLSTLSFSQVNTESDEDEYTERSYEEIEEERGHKKVWVKHPNPSSFKGELSYEEFDQNHIAILGDGKILLLEPISDDIEIVGEWFDYYIVYTQSTRKLVVKGRTGNPISSMLVPANCEVIGLLKDGMSDIEIMYTTHAFDIENIDTGSIKRYDKFCKLLVTKQ
jgi:hypothetical protein